VALVKQAHQKDMASGEEARRLQAIEYERRLSSLNGEAGKLHQMQATYVPREVFENASNEVAKRLKILEEARAAGAGRDGIIGFILPAVVSMIVSALVFLASFALRKP